MTPVGFETTVPASQRPQTNALDGEGTGDRRYKEYDINVINH